MPIIIDGSKVFNLIDLNDAYKKSDSIKVSNEYLKSQKVDIVGETRYVLYVAQKEFAVVAPGPDAPELVGTDESTTCHILILVHSGSGVCCLAHLDGSYTREGINRLLTKFKQSSLVGPEGRFELHIVGGFHEQRNFSKKLSLEVISCLLAREEELHLMTYCVCDENDEVRDGIHFPIITGLAYNTRTRAIFPAEFTYKGPDNDIRSASGFALKQKMLDIYVNKCLVVGPFDWSVICNVNVDELDEASIRQNFSTSPEQESKYFVEHIRSTFRILMDHPQSLNSLFKNGQARKYKWNASKLIWDRSN
ncbi:hypothetical protein HELRODRAFT_99061 [Helobdella robusta]|uniref:Protein N-terminal asparagine amidohydrolase n=1 Tax=Helobdella robusta TaxID=6412 RepID=T1G9Q7_HELRO|nr:hypothetical protein HELRODRAFT_99061 [Helobdella robusta]ESO05173.1 hypothetical protein HELRODRAFT_99061 [Helobdella robusta]